MNDSSAIALGEYVGRKLKKAEETNEPQKRENALYHASAALKGAGGLIKKMPDELERSLILRDINLGVNAELASLLKQQKGKIRYLYESILHRLDL
jgi:hypothetical protein